MKIVALILCTQLFAAVFGLPVGNPNERDYTPELTTTEQEMYLIITSPTSNASYSDTSSSEEESGESAILAETLAPAVEVSTPGQDSTTEPSDDLIAEERVQITIINRPTITSTDVDKKSTSEEVSDKVEPINVQPQETETTDLDTETTGVGEEFYSTAVPEIEVEYSTTTEPTGEIIPIAETNRDGQQESASDEGSNITPSTETSASTGRSTGGAEDVSDEDTMIVEVDLLVLTNVSPDISDQDTSSSEPAEEPSVSASSISPDL